MPMFGEAVPDVQALIKELDWHIITGTTDVMDNIIKTHTKGAETTKYYWWRGGGQENVVKPGTGSVMRWCQWRSRVRPMLAISKQGSRERSARR